MVVPAVLACLRKTRPGLAHEAKAATRHLRSGNGVNRDGERFFGFARSRGRHADSGFAVSRELGAKDAQLALSQIVELFWQRGLWNARDLFYYAETSIELR